jgi:hypothetical protein
MALGWWWSDHKPNTQTRIVDPEHGDESTNDKEDDLSEYKDPGFDFWEEALGDGGGEEGQGAECHE